MELSLFAYRRGNSAMHRLPSGIKLVLLFGLCIGSFSGKGSWIPTAICFVLSWAVFFLAGARWKAIGQLSFVLFLGGFVTLFRTVEFQPLGISMEGLFSGLMYLVRFFSAAFTAQSVFETTSPLQIQNCLETVESDIAKVIPPVKKLSPAFILSLTINFIPMVFETWNRTATAAKARSPKKAGIPSFTRNLFAQMSAFLSCILFKAESKRRAVINRGGFN